MSSMSIQMPYFYIIYKNLKKIMINKTSLINFKLSNLCFTQKSSIIFNIINLDNNSETTSNKVFQMLLTSFSTICILFAKTVLERYSKHTNPVESIINLKKKDISNDTETSIV